MDGASEHPTWNTHARSGSWCIAHFVVIFNHIIQRYVFIVLFLLLADSMEILFAVGFSLFCLVQWWMRWYLCYYTVAAAQNARASTAKLLLLWLGNFRSRALEWYVLRDRVRKSPTACRMHQYKANGTDIVLGAALEQNCKCIQTNNWTNSAHDWEYIILHYDVNHNNNASENKEKQIKRTRRRRTAASKSTRWDSPKATTKRWVHNKYSVVLSARTQQAKLTLLNWKVEMLMMWTSVWKASKALFLRDSSENDKTWVNSPLESKLEYIWLGPCSSVPFWVHSSPNWGHDHEIPITYDRQFHSNTFRIHTRNTKLIL